MASVRPTSADTNTATESRTAGEARRCPEAGRVGIVRAAFFAEAPALTPLLLLAVLATGVHVGLVLGLRTLYRPALPRWQAGLFWVDYGNGFVRRGLPGELLSRAVGHPPTAAQVTGAGLVLSGAAIAGLLVLAAVLARRARSPGARLVVFTVVVTSPFTLTLVAWDPGRYDDVGVVVLVGLVLAGRSVAAATARRWPLHLAVAVATTAAVASEEFLVAFVVPVALLALQDHDREPASGRRPSAVALLTIVPALTLAAVSMWAAVPSATVGNAFAEAQQAGIRITERPWTNGIVVLDRSIGDAATYTATLSPWTRVLVPLGFAVLYLLCAVLVWRAIGRPAPCRFGWLVAGYGAVAVLLGLVGVDYRRWWALAFVALLASVILLRPTAARAVPAGANMPRFGRRPAVVVGLVGVSLCVQLMPVYPTWDPALGGELPPAVRVVEALTGLGG